MSLRQAIDWPIVRHVARRFRRQRIRSILRGHRAYTREGRQGLMADVMVALTHCQVQPGKAFLWLAGVTHQSFEMTCRQFVLLRVRGTIALNNAILAAKGRPGPVIHPLPREWRAELRRLGVPVAGVRSALLWWAYVWVFWSFGVGVMFQTLVESLRTAPEGKSFPDGTCAHFSGLSRENLPQTSDDGRSLDVLSWYWQWAGRPAGVRLLTHTVGKFAGGAPPFSAVAHTLPPLHGGDLFRFVVWSAAASAVSALDLLRGRWGHAMLLGELALAARVRLQRRYPLALEYLFHASDIVYRPCWTYEAEARGCWATMYCYSTNSEPFTLADSTTGPLHSWQVLTWSRILVWDEGQADFIRRATSDRVQPTVVGPIWFHSSATVMSPVAAGAVAVFDVQPHRNSRRPALAMHHPCYEPATAAAFLRDITTVATECGRQVIFKRKRRASPVVHRGYLRVVDRLAASASLTSIDPDISAIRVIDACDAVISTPFTSTALLGRAQGRPSIYYDPLATLHPHDPAAHGVPIIQGREALRSWFQSLREASPSTPET